MVEWESPALGNIRNASLMDLVTMVNRHHETPTIMAEIQRRVDLLKWHAERGTTNTATMAVIRDVVSEN